MQQRQGDELLVAPRRGRSPRTTYLFGIVVEARRYAEDFHELVGGQKRRPNDDLFPLRHRLHSTSAVSSASVNHCRSSVHFFAIVKPHAAAILSICAAVY